MFRREVESGQVASVLLVMNAGDADSRVYPMQGVVNCWFITHFRYFLFRFVGVVGLKSHAPKCQVFLDGWVQLSSFG